MDRTKQIRQFVATGVHTDDDRELLGNSFFYYCCGSDPTPIIAFGDRYPLYVYVDLVGYGKGVFGEETKKLYQRIEKAGFKRTNSIHTGAQYSVESYSAASKPIIKQLELSRWLSKEEKDFHLLFIQGDAYSVFSKLYFDKDLFGHSNFIKPHCIYTCNPDLIQSKDVQCEPNPNCACSALRQAEKRANKVMGDCFHGRNYMESEEYDYYGDCDQIKKIVLYKRICYYKTWWCY